MNILDKERGLRKKTFYKLCKFFQLNIFGKLCAFLELQGRLKPNKGFRGCQVSVTEDRTPRARYRIVPLKLRMK